MTKRGQNRFSENKAKAIADIIEDKIKDGTYKSGQALPGRDSTASRFAVGTHTICRVYEILTERDLIKAKPGIGKFVK